jgi:hypothetical protein
LLNGLMARVLDHLPLSIEFPLEGGLLSPSRPHQVHGHRIAEEDAEEKYDTTHEEHDQPGIGHDKFPSDSSGSSVIVPALATKASGTADGPRGDGKQLRMTQGLLRNKLGIPVLRIFWCATPRRANQVELKASWQDEDCCRADLRWFLSPAIGHASMASGCICRSRLPIDHHFPQVRLGWCPYTTDSTHNCAVLPHLKHVNIVNLVV